MNRDTSGGAVHGLGKRGMDVSMSDHGCAGEEPEGLAHYVEHFVMWRSALYLSLFKDFSLCLLCSLNITDGM